MDDQKLCLIERCGKRSYCKGWCQAHYARWRKHGDPMGGAHYVKRGTPCIVDGCGKPSQSSGLCPSHRHQNARYGSPTGGHWTRGRYDPFLATLSMDGTEECIEWPFFVGENGYGRISKGSDTGQSGDGAHRYVCRMFHGEPIAADLHAAHSCNKKSCVNPRHLRWATPLENIQDKWTDGTMPVGETVWNAKLTKDKVDQIRRDRPFKFLRELAAEYGVSIAVISKVCRGDTWA